MLYNYKIPDDKYFFVAPSNQQKYSNHLFYYLSLYKNKGLKNKKLVFHHPTDNSKKNPIIIKTQSKWVEKTSHRKLKHLNKYEVNN